MEYFETFDETGASMGLVMRADVHRLGLWHRSVHCFAWNSAGQMLLQRRADDKDLYAGCWDYAVGEHLKPGESWLRGIRRGLAEELGVSGAAPIPLGSTYREAQRWPGGIDAEIQQAFVLRCDGPFTADAVEVAALEWVDRAELRRRVTASPARFTPWFVRELARLDILAVWDQSLKALS